MTMRIFATLALASSFLTSPAIADTGPGSERSASGVEAGAIEAVLHERGQPPTIARKVVVDDDPDVDSDAPMAATMLSGSRATRTVGPGNCDHADLQAAIDASASGDTIFIADGGGYTGGSYQIWGKSLTIRGGYSECDVSETPSGRTVLNANGINRVFDIWQAGVSDIAVTLENLSIRGGNATGWGGGVLVEGNQGDLAVSLVNVEVRDSQSATGGGGVAVRVNGDRTGNGVMLTMDNDSALTGNTTASNGGGIACTNAANSSVSGTLVRLGAIDILGNTAVNGGGISVDNCRNFFYYSGGPVVVLLIPFPTGALAFNDATEAGGGLHVTGESTVFLRGSTFSGFGEPDHAAHVAFNEAVTGGGVAIDGVNAELFLTDTVLRANSAIDNGGAIQATNGASVTLERALGQAGCVPEESEDGVITVPRCSRVLNNNADRDGGGFYVDNGAVVDVDRTIVSENFAGALGSVVRARSDLGSGLTGRINFENSLIHSNSGSAIFYAWTNSRIDVRWSTVTDNDVGIYLFRGFTNSGEAHIDIRSSILWEDSGTAMGLAGDGQLTAAADCVIAYQDVGDTDFTSSNFYSNIDPQLIEHEDNPYFPAPTSPAIDYCDAFNTPPDVDLVRIGRGSEHQGPPLTSPPSSVSGGTFDLGAYETEWQPLTDELFDDRFEGQ